MRSLAVINSSNTNLDSSEVEILICYSTMSPIGGAEVGVEIKHIGTGIIVRSVELRTQYKNKLAALELLAERLLK
jgi:protein subunit release factor A